MLFHLWMRLVARLVQQREIQGPQHAARRGERHAEAGISRARTLAYLSGM